MVLGARRALPCSCAGEPADGVYFLVSGSLAAFRPAERSRHNLLGYVRPGEPVGEMALIAREPHTASVFAMRDSEMLKLSPEAFDRLIQAHPTLMRHIARLMLARARGRRGKPARRTQGVRADLHLAHHRSQPARAHVAGGAASGWARAPSSSARTTSAP